MNVQNWVRKRVWIFKRLVIEIFFKQTLLSLSVAKSEL